MLFKRAEISKPEDYFLELSKRRERSGYFCRLNGYSQGMRDFIRRYYEAASERGVIIEGKLNNPGFTGKAPAALVESERAKLEKNRQMLETLKKRIAELG